MIKNHHHTHHIRKVHLAKYIVVSSVFLLCAWSAVRLVDSYSNNVLPYATEMSNDNLLQATNDERSQVNAGSLFLNERLSQAAQLKANDMAARNYWSHDTPDGEPPWIFINQVGYVYIKAGENLAYGFSNSRGAIAGWMNSPMHRENMLDSMFTEVGFGYSNSSSYQKNGKQTIVVAMYGSPALTKAPAANLGQSTDITTVLQGSASPMDDAAMRYSTNAAVGTSAGLSTFNVLDSAEPKAVSRLQAYLGESVTISTTLIIAFLAILAGAYIAKHYYAIRRILVHGEQILVHHPIMDICLLSLMTLGYIMTRAAGYIQ